MSTVTVRCAHCGSAHPELERLCPTTGLPLARQRRKAARASERAQELDPSLAPGTSVADRYRIVGVLGAGGMSTVVEARRLDRAADAPDASVALKVLHRALSDDQEAIARLLREADVVRSLAHPNVCAVLDLGRLDSGQPYLVMERLRGQSLAERLDEGPLSVGEVAAVLLPICAALEAAHARGILHRDLKPENVFILAHGPGGPREAKLLDFGVARPFGQDVASHRLTDTGMVMGTPYYMAPEQARGEVRLDQRVDVWALGVILYEALSGERPFVAANYNALLVKILTAQPRPLEQLVPDVSSIVSRIVDKALAKRPEDRFATVQELAEALRLAQREWMASDLDAPTVALPRRASRTRSDTPTEVVAPHHYRRRTESVVGAAASPQAFAEATAEPTVRDRVAPGRATKRSPPRPRPKSVIAKNQDTIERPMETLVDETVDDEAWPASEDGDGLTAVIRRR